jgi:hypothetical protein
VPETVWSGSSVNTPLTSTHSLPTDRRTDEPPTARARVARARVAVGTGIVGASARSWRLTPAGGPTDRRRSTDKDQLHPTDA